jgi:hypothetical protein
VVFCIEKEVEEPPMIETVLPNDAGDTPANYAAECNTAARYAADIVKTICEKVGPGLPGTVQERERALVIKKELEAHLGAENVTIEEFHFAPGALIASERMSALFLLAAALLNMTAGSLLERSPAVAAVATTLAAAFAALPVLLFLFQFVRAGEVIDPLLKKGTSINVIGTLRRQGTKTVKQLLLLGGHHDSAWEDTWLRLLGNGFFFVSGIFFLSMIAMLGMSLIQLTGMIFGNAGTVRMGTLGWAMLVFLIAPAVIFSLTWHQAVKPGGVVPGAVDNLSASALTVAMCALLAKNPACIPEDTEIRFISFGSEEAGLRGSRRYVARHLEELKHLDARMLNYEMVADPEIAIITSDRNGTVKNDPAMVKSVIAAAEHAGVPYRMQAASLGTCTDAGSFTQAGLKAAALIPFRFPQQFVAFYHQRWDGPDKVTIEPLVNVLKLTLEWIRCGGE